MGKSQEETEPAVNIKKEPSAELQTVKTEDPRNNDNEKDRVTSTVPETNGNRVHEEAETRTVSSKHTSGKPFPILNAETLRKLIRSDGKSGSQHNIQSQERDLNTQKGTVDPTQTTIRVDNKPPPVDREVKTLTPRGKLYGSALVTGTEVIGVGQKVHAKIVHGEASPLSLYGLNKVHLIDVTPEDQVSIVLDPRQAEKYFEWKRSKPQGDFSMFMESLRKGPLNAENLRSPRASHMKMRGSNASASGALQVPRFVNQGVGIIHTSTAIQKQFSQSERKIINAGHLFLNSHNNIQKTTQPAQTGPMKPPTPTQPYPPQQDSSHTLPPGFTNPNPNSQSYGFYHPLPPGFSQTTPVDRNQYQPRAQSKALPPGFEYPNTENGPEAHQFPAPAPPPEQRPNLPAGFTTTTHPLSSPFYAHLPPGFTNGHQY